MRPLLVVMMLWPATLTGANAQTFVLPVADNSVPATFACQPGKVFEAVIDGQATKCKCPDDAGGKILYPYIPEVTNQVRRAVASQRKTRASRPR